MEKALKLCSLEYSMLHVRAARVLSCRERPLRTAGWTHWVNNAVPCPFCGSQWANEWQPHCTYIHQRLTKSCHQQWQRNSNYSIGERVLGATKSDTATEALNRTVNKNGTFGLRMRNLQYRLLHTCYFITEKEYVIWSWQSIQRHLWNQKGLLEVFTSLHHSIPFWTFYTEHKMRIIKPLWMHLHKADAGFTIMDHKCVRHRLHK